MNTEKRKELQLKRKELQEKLESIEKQTKLDSYISILKECGLQKVNIPDVDIPKSQLFKDTWKYDPEIPIFKTFSYRQGNKLIDIKTFVIEWVKTNSNQSVLFSNDKLMNNKDWLEINSNELLLNFDSLFNKLDIEHNILMNKDSKDFLSICEFEEEVFIYKGKVKDEKIEYYS